MTTFSARARSLAGKPWAIWGLIFGLYVIARIVIIVGGVGGGHVFESWDSAVYAYRELVEAGGLMAFGPNYAEMHRRGAAYVDRILRGAKAGDLPVELPTKFELIVNMRAAKALELTIPESVLVRADVIIR